jgi:hypothetical protein
VNGMRAVYLLVVALIAAGLVYAIVVGLLRR